MKKVKLQCLKSGMVGRPLVAASAEPCTDWKAGGILEVSLEDAKVLLALPDHFEPVGKKPAAPEAPPAPVQSPEGIAPSEDTGSPDESDDSSEEYTQEELASMTVAELLEFLDETDRPAASKMKKAEVIALIMGED